MESYDLKCWLQLFTDQHPVSALTYNAYCYVCHGMKYVNLLCLCSIDLLIH